MYIRSIKIENIRSITELEWKIPDEEAAGWHVIIGDNGSGKTAFLRSVALALVGRDEALALRQNLHNWIRKGADHSEVLLHIKRDVQFDKFSDVSSKDKKAIESYEAANYLPVSIALKRWNENLVRWKDNIIISSPDFPYVWGGKTGWFSAAYGSFRRFSTSFEDSETGFPPRLVAHLSLFGENFGLECLRWLRELRFKQLEDKSEGHLLNLLINFVNLEGLLPYAVKFDKVTSEGVIFVDGSGCIIPVEDLSDGYGSILSMTFELIRQMARAYGPDKVFDPDDPTKIVVPGVVLIDEVDAHLHPTWQRRVGVWFREHFPKIQFIVTTHSPLVCQAATVGTVFRLPRPGNSEKGSMVSGVALNRLRYGNVLDAYSTELFGDTSRSEEGKQKLQRLAELNYKELHGQLSKNEREEQQQLRASVPTAAHTLLRDKES